MIIIVLNYGVGVFLDFFDDGDGVLLFVFGDDGDLRVVVGVFLFVFGDFGDDGDG